MFKTTKKRLVGLALALGVGAAGVVAGTEAAMSKTAFEAAQDRIEAQAEAQAKACARFKGHAKDLCRVQARGWEKVAKAQLEAQHEPSPEAQKNVKFARAEADHDVARRRCEPLKERARDLCVERAKHEREAAIRLAKVEKVEEQRQAQRAAPKS